MVVEEVVQFLGQKGEMWWLLGKILWRREGEPILWGQIRIHMGLFFLSKRLVGGVKMR